MKAEHMSGKRKYSDYQEADDCMNIGYEGIETEVVAEKEFSSFFVIFSHSCPFFCSTKC